MTFSNLYCEKESVHDYIRHCATFPWQSSDCRVWVQTGVIAPAYSGSGDQARKRQNLVRNSPQTGRRRLDRQQIYSRIDRIQTVKAETPPAFLSIDDALAKGYLQDLRYSTRQGQRIPVRTVPMENYRLDVDEDTLLIGYCSSEQCARREADLYLQAVANVRHPYWVKYYTALGRSRLH